MLVVPAKQLIGTISGKGNRNMTPGILTQYIYSHGRGVGKRLIDTPEDFL
jgi:hypothetical protein